jgi:hypothetical protein
MKTYAGIITKLEPHQIFVFGSNTQGRHGAGTALDAVTRFGAINGQARGLQGQSYAIVTKDLTHLKQPSIEKDEIIRQIYMLYSYARMTPSKEFVIAYSGTGKNLNGYTPKQMADMFAAHPIPVNIVFEEKMALLVQQAKPRLSHQ